MGDVPVRIGRRAFIAGALATTTSCSLGFSGNGGSSREGFGGELAIGTIADLQGFFAGGDKFFYLPEGRLWVVEVPEDLRETLKAVVDPRTHSGIDAGFTALYQTCPHLGCRVPECTSSGQFECPCHGSSYGRLGEKRGGPAPRGMDRFPMRVANGELFVDTGTIIQGLPIGTVLGIDSEGPTCLPPGLPE